MAKKKEKKKALKKKKKAAAVKAKQKAKKKKKAKKAIKKKAKKKASGKLSKAKSSKKKPKNVSVKKKVSPDPNRTIKIVSKSKKASMPVKVQAVAVQCKGKTRSGARCKRITKNPGGMCTIHKKK